MKTWVTKVAEIVNNQIENDLSITNKTLRRWIRKWYELMGIEEITPQRLQEKEYEEQWEWIVSPLRETAKEIATATKAGFSYVLDEVVIICPSDEQRQKLFHQLEQLQLRIQSDGSYLSAQMNNTLKLYMRPIYPSLEITPQCRYRIEVSEHVGNAFMSKALVIRYTGRWQANTKQPFPESSLVSLMIELKDASGSKTITIERFPATIGRNIKNDIVVNANYVSMEHATIAYEEGKIIYLDSSTNGTFVNGIEYKKKSRELVEKDILILGGNTKQVFNDYAQIEVMKIKYPDKTNDLGMQMRSTPVSKPVDEPKTGMQIRPTPSILFYEISLDLHGKSKSFLIDGIKISFPISIGRGDDQMIRIPTDMDADDRGILQNAVGTFKRNSVSRAHLQIIEMTDDSTALKIRSTGTNGTYIDDKRYDGEFILPMGATMVLGNDTPPVRLTCIKMEGK